MGGRALAAVGRHRQGGLRPRAAVRRALVDFDDAAYPSGHTAYAVALVACASCSSAAASGWAVRFAAVTVAVGRRRGGRRDARLPARALPHRRARRRRAGRRAVVAPGHARPRRRATCATMGAQTDERHPRRPGLRDRDRRGHRHLARPLGRLHRRAGVAVVLAAARAGAGARDERLRARRLRAGGRAGGRRGALVLRPV